MNTGVYPKDSEHAQRAEGENRVDLNYAQETELRNALDEQMRQHGLTGLQKSVLSVIFRQTIGYRKRAEDMNGKLLEKLVGSRYDYCNRNLKILISHSIVIAEEGYYGRILSINYDFAQWGKTPEENGDLVSEPEKLLISTLQLEQTANADDASLDLQPELHEAHSEAEASEQAESVSNTPALQDEAISDALAPHENTISNAPALPDQDRSPNVAEAQTHENQNLSEHLIAGLQASMQALKEEVADLKALLREVLPNCLPNLSSEKEKAESGANKIAVEAIPAPLATPEPCEIHADEDHIHEDHEHKKACIDEVISTLVPKLKLPFGQANDETLAPCNTEAILAPKPSLEHVNDEAPASCKTEDKAMLIPQPENAPDKNKDNHNPPVTQEDLQFPEELKPHEKTAIAKVLEAEDIKDKSIAQLLLDDLKSRYQITDWEPIRSPIAYFRSLIRRFKQNNFVTDYVEAYRAQRKADGEKAAKEKQSKAQNEQTAQYQEASHQYRQAAFLASCDGCSLREMAKRQRWESLIEAMGFNLDIAPEQVLHGAR